MLMFVPASMAFRIRVYLGHGSGIRIQNSGFSRGSVSQVCCHYSMGAKAAQSIPIADISLEYAFNKTAGGLQCALLRQGFRQDVTKKAVMITCLCRSIRLTDIEAFKEDRK